MLRFSCSVMATAAVFTAAISVGLLIWSGTAIPHEPGYEALVVDRLLDDETICRICSCGIDTSLCWVHPSWPGVYSDTGRNRTDCGGCRMSPPEQFAPDWPEPFQHFWNLDDVEWLRDDGWVPRP